MLQTAFIIAFSCIGIHVAFTWKGMIFKGVGDYLDLRLNKYIKKPLFACPMCMASLWSNMYWLVFNPLPLIMLPIMILLVCGINTLLSSAIYYFHEED